jgi:proteasome lid subunit RPN8/RPN11
VVISRAQVNAIIGQAKKEFPDEACGLLAGAGDRIVCVYPVRNARASPVYYEMDAGEQLRALEDIDERGWELAAVYHSHTHTRAYPSRTDVEVAQATLAFYPETLYVIVSLAYPDNPDFRAFRIEGTEIREVPVTIDEAATEGISPGR